MDLQFTQWATLKPLSIRVFSVLIWKWNLKDIEERIPLPIYETCWATPPGGSGNISLSSLSFFTVHVRFRKNWRAFDICIHSVWFDSLRKETFLHFELCAWQTVNLHIVDLGLQQVTKKQIMIFRCSYALNVRGINYSRLRVGIRLHQVCLNWNLPMRVLHNQRSSITKLWNSEIEPKLNAVRIIAYMIRTPQVEDCSKMQSSIYESSAVRMPSGQFLAEGHCSTWTTHLRDLLVSRGTEISGDGGDPTWSMRDLEHGG